MGVNQQLGQRGVIATQITSGNNMFTFQKDANEFLYHYTDIVKCKLITAGKSLRCSPFVETNDPKESKDWFFIPGTNDGRDLSTYDAQRLSQTLNPLVKHNVSLICFSTDAVLTGNHLEDMPRRGFCKPRMWAQYANKHQGACLIFDARKLLSLFFQQFCDDHLVADRVVYADRLIADIQQEPAYIINVDSLESTGLEEYALAHRQKYVQRLFFEKASDWRDEHEYRLVKLGGTPGIYLNLDNALRGVIFGADCREEDITEIVHLTKAHGCQYQQIVWRNCTPWFNFGRTRW